MYFYFMCYVFGWWYIALTILMCVWMIPMSIRLETSPVFLVFLYQSELILKMLIFCTPISWLHDHAILLCNIRNKKQQLRLDLADFRKKINNPMSKERLFHLVVRAHVLTFHKKINNMPLRLYLVVRIYKIINCKLNQVYKSLRFKNLPLRSGFPFEKQCLEYLLLNAPDDFIISSGWFHSENRSGEADIVVFRKIRGIFYLVAIMECKLGHPDQKAYQQVKHKLKLARRYMTFVNVYGRVINFKTDKPNIYILHGTPFFTKTPAIKIIIAGHRRNVLMYMFGLAKGTIHVKTTKTYGSFKNRCYTCDEIIDVSKKDWAEAMKISYYWHSERDSLADEIFKASRTKI